MLLYFAGNTISLSDCQVVYDTGVRHKLLTFAEINDWAKHAFDFWVYNKPADAKVFMDCGAFSALMRGVVIDLDRYMAFCHTYASVLETYVQLDKVGDPVMTRKNLVIMEAEGLHPIPVYTAAAPISELERLCERYDHIALGGLRGKDAGTNEWRRLQLNKTFKAAKKYWPRKFHAFGITSQWVLEQYPLYSADSSAAIVGGGMGRVMTFEDGKIQAEPWVKYARRTYDGDVMDVVGNTGVTSTESAHWGRRCKNIKTMLAFERYINRLWELRGITW